MAQTHRVKLKRKHSFRVYVEDSTGDKIWIAEMAVIFVMIEEVVVLIEVYVQVVGGRLEEDVEPHFQMRCPFYIPLETDGSIPQPVEYRVSCNAREWERYYGIPTYCIVSMTEYLLRTKFSPWLARKG